jgi:hypothetical protein
MNKLYSYIFLALVSSTFILPSYAITNQSINSTNSPCKIEATYIGRELDNSGKTNAIIKYIIQVQDNEKYSILTSSESNYCKVYIYSLDKEKRIDKILNEEDNFGVRNDTPHFVLISRDRPFTNILSLPLELLTNSKYGLVASVAIVKNLNNEQLSLVKGTKHTIQSVKLISHPFDITNKN